jgi:hypothetical protein
MSALYINAALAAVYTLLGVLLGDVLRGRGAALRTAEPEPEGSRLPPPGSQELDPDWCHSHNRPGNDGHEDR